MKKLFLIICSCVCVFLFWDGITLYRTIGSEDTTQGRFLFLGRDGSILTNFPKPGGYHIGYTGTLDHRAIQDIITIEDKRFFSHMGIDIRGKIAALVESYTAGKIVRGGSTITEQYVKNRYFESAPRTWMQKMREAWYALILETKYSKAEILRKYLDSIYFGNGIYGLETAMEEYFHDESLDTLSHESITEIITRLRYPNITGNAEDYRNRVSERLGYGKPTNMMPSRGRPHWTDMFPYLTARIMREVSAYCSGSENTLDHFVRNISENLCEQGDMMLFTAIDPALSHFATRTLESVLSGLTEKNVTNGSIYVWDEREKKVLLYIGNRTNTSGNAIDMITRKRSVGSTLKPFLYHLAFERGADPNMLILDDTASYATEKAEKSYTPENYVTKNYGPITLKKALGNSLNSASVRLLESIGVGRFYESLRKRDIPLERDSGYYGYGIILGGVELSLEDLVRGYRGLMDIKDPINFLLFTSLADSANRSETFGISSILNTSANLAVKTGTSTDFRDNWAIGYNNDLIVGVWVGNVDGSSMDDVSGVTGAGPIYHAVAEALIGQGYTGQNAYTAPEIIDARALCLDEKCFQEEIVYTTPGYSRTSRPKSAIYSEKDFVTPLSPEEKAKWMIRE